MSEHSEQVLKMHKAMVDIGNDKPAADVVAALALTVAYACRYCLDTKYTVEEGLTEFIGLAKLEYDDPNSEMAKPE